MREEPSHFNGESWGSATGDKEYERLLRVHILSLLSARPASFCEIVRHAGGAFPTDVRKSLHSLSTQGHVRVRRERYSLGREKAQSLLSPFSIRGNPIHENDRTLERRSARKTPVLADPHPADYDWRFTIQSMAKVSQLLKHGADGSKIALLGTPALFLYLMQRGADAVLFDRSQSLIADLHAAGFQRNLIRHDMFEPFHHIPRKFQVALADPPWYPEFFKAFTIRASELLCEEGLLLLSILPWLTRPSAISDRAEIIDFASRVGFDLIEVSPQFFRYETPTFEFAALNTQGIRCGDWRSGDLYAFRKVREQTERPHVPPIPGEAQWDDFRFGNLKVKLRHRDDKGQRGFHARPISGNAPVLQTVSRRWPLRSEIDLWTSGNVAYTVQGLQPLRAAFKMLQKGKSPDRVGHEVAAQYALPRDNEQSLVQLLKELTEKRHRSQS